MMNKQTNKIKYLKPSYSNDEGPLFSKDLYITLDSLIQLYCDKLFWFGIKSQMFFLILNNEFIDN